MITQVVRRMLVAGFLASVLTSNIMAQALSPEELKALNAAVGKAIDAHDVNGIVGYMAPDAVFDFVPAPPPLTGTNAIGGFFAGLFHGYPDYATIGEQRWVSGSAVVTAHTTTGTLQNEWMGLPPTGKDTNSPPSVHLDIWEYQGDKIQRITTYADIQSLMVGLGLMPAPQLPPLQPITPIPDPVPTGLSPVAAVIESQARWNAHDLAGLARMMHTNAQVLMPMLQDVPLDRKAFVAVQELYFLACKDLKMDVVRHLDLGEGWVLSEVVYRGINDGPYFGVPATGRSVNVRGAILYQVDGQGLLSTMKIYFDNITNLTQLGLFPPPLSPEELKALNAGVGKAIDAHDVNGIVGYWAPDAVFDFVPAPPPLIGTNAIGGFFAGLFHGFPDYATVAGQRWVSGNAVVTAHTTTGTLQNAWMGLPATGKGSIPNLHLDIWEYQGDKIQRVTTYAELQSLMVSVGLMPAPQLPPLQPVTQIPDPVPTGLTPVAAVIEGQARWNAHDLAGVAKMMRTNAQVVFAMLGVPLDRKAFTAMNELYFLAFRDLRIDVVRHLDLGAGWVLSEGVYRGINDGPYFGLPATGRAVNVRVAIVYQVDSQGLFSAMNVYFDNITALTQLGLFPPPGPELQLTIDMCAALTIQGTPGKTVGVEYRSAIDAGDTWKPLVDFVLPATPFLFVDTNSIGQTKRFYRALERQ
jgi:ketosteroid isomerase-like protein